MSQDKKVDQTINGDLITNIATNIAVSSDTNASSHDKLWSEVKSLFENEPMAKTKDEVKSTCNKVWTALESYIVDGHNVARKAYYEADPEQYATQYLKVSDNKVFMAVPSDKGLNLSKEGGFDNYQTGKDYVLSFAECYEVDKATYSALPYDKGDGTDLHEFGKLGKSLQDFMKENRVRQQEYMTQKKSNVISGWKKRYTKYCGIVAPESDPKLWEDDLKAELVKTSDFFNKAKKSGKHMSTKKREAWETWFKQCPVNLSSS
mgnify:FL=1